MRIKGLQYRLRHSAALDIRAASAPDVFTTALKMLLYRVASFFVVLFAFTGLALAMPAKRASTAEIQSILTTLQSSITPTLASISQYCSQHYQDFTHSYMYP